MVLGGKSLQEYSLNADLCQGYVLFPTFLPLYINDLVICNAAIFTDDAMLYCSCNWSSDMWQQLEYASALESD